MEEYWKSNEPEGFESPDQTASGQDLFDESDFVEEAPRPKRKKKMTFKRKVKRAIRRFFKLPLLTRILSLVAVVILLAVIILLIVLLPKSCNSDPSRVGATTGSPSPSFSAEAPTPENVIETPYYTPAPAATPVPIITNALKLNDSHDAIPLIRSRLVELGYMEMPATNDPLYDQATQNAVKRFQCRNFPDNFKAWDGWIGTQTYDQLLSSSAKAFYLKSGDTDKTMYDGDLVTKLQQQLIALGYSLKATGSYDQATVDAVRKFQKQNSLDSDGVAGQMTLKLLASAAAAPATDAPASPDPQAATAGPAATDAPAGSAETTPGTETQP